MENYSLLMLAEENFDIGLVSTSTRSQPLRNQASALGGDFQSHLVEQLDRCFRITQIAAQARLKTGQQEFVRTD